MRYLGQLGARADRYAGENGADAAFVTVDSGRFGKDGKLAVLVVVAEDASPFAIATGLSKRLLLRLHL